MTNPKDQPIQLFLPLDLAPLPPDRPRRRAHSFLYDAHLRSPEWVRTRRRLIAKAQRRCERCHRFAEGFDVHHLTYRNLGFERDEDLQVLCRNCHRLADMERMECKGER